MPGMNGRELAEHLTDRHRTMKVLYMSGYTEDTIIRYGVELGQTAFLQKSFTPDALLRKVRNMLEATTE
jgi:two-component system, cell cycle sensor histidine kinase and response regulator CckA